VVETEVDILYTEDKGVQSKARNAQVVWDLEGIEPAPDTRYCFERQCRHYSDLPVIQLISLLSISKHCLSAYHGPSGVVLFLFFGGSPPDPSPPYAPSSSNLARSLRWTLVNCNNPRKPIPATAGMEYHCILVRASASRNLEEKDSLRCCCCC